MSNTPRSLTRRPSRTVPATLTALTALALGATGTWLVGTRLLTGSWPQQARTAVSHLAATQLGSLTVLTLGCLLVLLGLLALWLALWPGRSRNVEVLADDVPGQTVISRKDLAGLVRHRVEQVDGVDSVSVRATGSRADIRVGSVIGDVGPLRQDVQAAAQEALTRLNPTSAVRARVRVRHTS